jgi:hypothetical protein
MNFPQANLSLERKERRLEARIPFQGEIRLGKGNAHLGMTLDICAGGVGFQSPVPFSQGFPLELVFLNDSVLVKGVARHCTPVNGSIGDGYFVGAAFDRAQPDLVEVLLATGAQAPI